MDNTVLLTSNGNLRDLFGSMPPEWSIAKIGDLFDIRQGKPLSKKYRIGTHLKPFLRTSNVYWGKLDLTTLDQMEFNETEQKKYTLQPRDLLVCEGGDIGRTAIWSGELTGCYYQNHLHRLRYKKSNIDPSFYMYWLWAGFRILKVYGGEGNRTTIPNLSQSRLQDFNVPFPPLLEQQAIAHTLNTVRQAIEATERVIEATRQLKKSMMKHLFTYGPVPVDQVDKVQLKETEIGFMPDHWQIVTIGDIANVTKLAGFEYTKYIKYATSGEIICIRALNLCDGKLDLSNVKYISRAVSEKLPRSKLFQGDLLLSYVGTVGSTAIVPDDNKYHLAPNVAKLTVRKSIISSEFLMRWLNTEAGRKELFTNVSKTSQPVISMARIRKLRIACPPIKEQMELIIYLQIIDNKIDKEIERKKILEELFRSLLSNLMTGHIRNG